MAGMRVVVVACDELGNVDLDDLRAKIDEHADRIAALMITYPSTHGVYEQEVGEICGLVHDAGGQVYVDGANLNALVGFAQPGEFGADVSHLNLHKTFCIPHGGGGPGVGPVAVQAHLAPFLPDHPLQRGRRPGERPGPRLGGAVGLGQHPADLVGLHPPDGPGRACARRRRSRSSTPTTSRAACASTSRCSTPARTASSRTSASSTCARSPRRPGVTVDDVAKRLIDYGFHAPTMCFPVAGTLMVEPTESRGSRRARPLRRRDDRDPGRDRPRRRGEWPADDNPLVNAPHTAEMLTRRVDAPVHARATPATRFPASAQEVLGAGAPHRPGVRRPQPRRAPARR